MRKEEPWAQGFWEDVVHCTAAQGGCSHSSHGQMLVTASPRDGDAHTQEQPSLSVEPF